MRFYYFVLALCCNIIIISCASKTQVSKGVVSLKVMSYNIHHCNPPSKQGVIDVDAIANAIKQEDPDIVAVQEVDVNTGRSGRINQAALLASKTNLKAFHFAKAIDHDGGDYGVLILSRYPLSDIHTYKLPMEANSQGEPRVLAMATVHLPGGKKMKFGSTHLDAMRNPANRLLQIKAINAIADTIAVPMIVAGDFNAEEGSEVIKLLDNQFTRTCSPCQPTIPAVNPKKAIDFIAYKPQSAFSVILHKVVNETYASDHLPVTAVMKLHF